MGTSQSQLLMETHRAKAAWRDAARLYNNSGIFAASAHAGADVCAASAAQGLTIVELRRAAHE